MAGNGGGGSGEAVLFSGHQDDLRGLVKSDSGTLPPEFLIEWL